MIKMLKLDFKDRKLLYELDCNSRQTIQQLAKKIGLSKDAIKYRINQLIKEGIIKSFNAVIDTGKLGFISFRLLLKFYNLSPSKENEILNFLLKNKNLIWLVQAEGSWDMNTWFLYKSIEEMNHFYETFLKRYNNYIQKREFGIYSSVIYYGREYLLDKGNNFSMQVVSIPKEQKLSESEIKIIALLSKDARRSIIDMAKESKLTPKTVIANIRKLEEKKIILGYRTEFNLDKLGYKYYKVHISTFNITPEKIKELNQYIERNKNIIYYDKVLGGYDIEIEIQMENEDKLRDLIDDLKKHFSGIIKDYDILNYYKEYRLRFFPSL